MAFILDNPGVVEAYLRDQEALERFNRAREQVAPKSS